MNMELKGLIMVGALALVGCQTSGQAAKDVALDDQSCVVGQKEMGCQTAYTANNRAAKAGTTAAVSDETCVAGQPEMGCQTAYTANNFDHVQPVAAVIIEAPAPEPAPAPVAAAPEAPPAVATSSYPGCDKPILTKSDAAVGDPCLTTADFIRSLNLPERRQARALATVNKIERSASPVAH